MADGLGVSQLVADVMTASLDHTHAVTQNVIDSLQADLREARAWRRAVEVGVSALLDSAWAPSAVAIERAVFHPDEVLLARCAASEDEEGL